MTLPTFYNKAEDIVKATDEYVRSYGHDYLIQMLQSQGIAGFDFIVKEEELEKSYDRGYDDGEDSGFTRGKDETEDEMNEEFTRRLKNAVNKTKGRYDLVEELKNIGGF